DVRARVVNRRTFGFKNKRMVQTNTYDADGNLLIVYQPTEEGSSPVVNAIYSHDNLGEVTQTFGADGETTEQCFDIRTRCVRNPRGYTGCEVLDDRGRIARFVDPINASCQDALAAAASGPAITYSYGPFDTLSTMIDQQQHRTVFGTDDLGHTTAI